MTTGAWTWKRAVAAAVLVAGCDASSLPLTPAPSLSTTQPGPGPTAPVVPVAHNPTRARLRAEKAYAIVYSDGSTFSYVPRFVLRETSGASRAQVEEILVIGPSSTDVAGMGCWRESVDVPAGGALDVFYTDDGAKWLGYCGPWIYGNTATPTLHVLVTFDDAYGAQGSIIFPISDIRPAAGR